ncbi:histidine kinase N-terminal 7TM domain-containing protein [Methanospirillum sp.]|uniref:histidine kinase N-terminal 7TM domain-containing protein n=1 Tax=Methanospirillum sp. TaxID=45200 RepID=UPI00359FA0C7
MDTIIILGLSCLISAIITYGLGIFVYAKNPDNRVNRFFLLLCIGASYWAVGEFLIWKVNSYENVFFWLKASSFWTVEIVMCIHFILCFADHPVTERKNRKYLLTILYIPAIILACINILTDNIFTIEYSPDFRYYYAPAMADPVYSVATLYFIIVLIWGAYVGLKAQKSAGTDILKRQSSSISIGLLILLGFGSQSVVILPMIGIFAPNLVFIGIVLFSLVISYAILKYGLFILTPESVATNIIQTMPDGLILTDMNGRVINANKTANNLLTKIYPANPVTFTRLPFPESVFSTIRNKITEKGVITDYELIPDSEVIKTVSISGSQVTDPDQNPAGLILIFRDITERKNSEKALKLANEKISLLTHLTRHDISNLVTAISGYLEMLMIEKDENRRKEIYFICQNIIEQITRHLHFSREYQSIGLHEPIWQDCERLVMKAVNDFQNSIVDLSIDLVPADIFADPLSVKVIYNLLENAMRHAKEIARIGIYSREEEDGSLLLIINDDGPGVKPEEKERIFMQGYGKNTGLGLTLAREILEVTDIKIRENGVYGKGARFEIKVPPGSWRKKSAGN